ATWSRFRCCCCARSDRWIGHQGDPERGRRVTLRSEIATPEGKRRYVRRLFATIADRYDFITGFLSYGQDRRWKRRLIALADLRADDRVLDLACGTGDILFASAPPARIAVGVDVTLRMLQLAQDRRGASGAGVGTGELIALPI